MTERKIAELGGSLQARIPDYRIWLIVGAFMIIIANLSIFALAFFYNMSIAHVDVSNLHLTSLSELCPGDEMSFAFDLEVTGEGEVETTQSFQRVESEDTVKTLFSSFTRFRIERTTKVTITRSFVLPELYINDLTGNMEPWESGQYILRMDARLAGRSQAESSDTELFTIKPDCERKVDGGL